MVFRIFDLPGEIRRQIYCQLLVNQANDEMPRGRIYPGKGPQKTVEPAMLRVCKRMHDEAAPVLYGQNEFCIYVDFYRFERFLFMIGKDNAAMIKKIWFRSFGLLPELHTALLETVDPSRGPLKALEKVTIVHSCYQASHQRAKRHQLSLEVRSLEARSMMANMPTLMVLDEDDDKDGVEVDPNDDLKVRTTIRFGLSRNVQHQPKVCDAYRRCYYLETGRWMPC
jgi:hypothetical protein